MPDNANAGAFLEGFIGETPQEVAYAFLYGAMLILGVLLLLSGGQTLADAVTKGGGDTALFMGTLKIALGGLLAKVGGTTGY